MTLYQFKLLDEMEQAEALWDAVHLMNRVEGPYRYELFQLHGFYVEQKRHIEYDVLHGLRSFRSTTPLEEYFKSDLPGKENK